MFGALTVSSRPVGFFSHLPIEALVSGGVLCFLDELERSTTSVVSHVYPNNLGSVNENVPFLHQQRRLKDISQWYSPGNRRIRKNRRKSVNASTHLVQHGQSK